MGAQWTLGQGLKTMQRFGGGLEPHLFDRGSYCVNLISCVFPSLGQKLRFRFLEEKPIGAVGFLRRSGHMTTQFSPCETPFAKMRLFGPF